MVRNAAWLIVLLLIPGAATGQIVVGKSQPDALTLGIVRVGATVEASFRIFEKGDDAAGVPLEIAPPAFVRVKQTRLGTQTFGNLGKFVTFDVIVSIDTATEAEYDEPIEVRIGEQHVEIPVTVIVSAQEPDQTRLLVLETPFHRFSTGDASLFGAWLDLVASENFDVHYFDVDRSESVLRDADLAEFDVVLLSGESLIFAQKADFEKLTQFMRDGGRVVVPANSFMQGTVAKANELLVPLGLRMDDIEPRGQGSFEIDESEIAADPLTAQVQRVKVSRPSPISVTDEEKGRILVGCPPFPEQAFVAASTVGRGEVIAIGASLWWNWIASDHEKGADNAVLLKNLLTKRRAE